MITPHARQRVTWSWPHYMKHERSDLQMDDKEFFEMQLKTLFPSASGWPAEYVHQRELLGRVLINRDWQAAAGHCPLCPQKRTFVSALSMSALCQ